MKTYFVKEDFNNVFVMLKLCLTSFVKHIIKLCLFAFLKIKVCKKFPKNLNTQFNQCFYNVFTIIYLQTIA